MNNVTTNQSCKSLDALSFEDLYVDIPDGDFPELHALFSNLFSAFHLHRPRKSRTTYTSERMPAMSGYHFLVDTFTTPDYSSGHIHVTH